MKTYHNQEQYPYDHPGHALRIDLTEERKKEIATTFLNNLVAYLKDHDLSNFISALTEYLSDITSRPKPLKVYNELVWNDQKTGVDLILTLLKLTSSCQEVEFTVMMFSHQRHGDWTYFTTYRKYFTKIAWEVASEEEGGSASASA